MPDAGVLATILLIVGLFLLALELMIPSFGMIGIMSAVTLLISAWCAWQAWWGTSPGFFWTYAAFWVLGIPSILGGALFVLQRTTVGNMIVLRGPGDESAGLSGDADSQLQAMVGKTGVAKSLLTPGGMVMVDQERYHAVSNGMLIEAGSPVKVTDVNGNRLVVRLCTAAETQQKKTAPAASPSEPLAETVVAMDAADEQQTDERAQSPDAGILDFDIPEG